jgi:crotonobetainyl-CoA:carnitine CoA-transferase CaiB-like acyl-CoA transferase
MTQVLKGVRVVELSTMITAPLAGMMLADLGAEVIKVEIRRRRSVPSFPVGITARTSRPTTAASAASRSAEGRRPRRAAC